MMTTLFVLFALVGFSVIVAQPLVTEQHTALMAVFDGLGESQSQTQTKKLTSFVQAAA
jgi:hypothetical protein